jgi:uncharacterized protein
MRGAVAALLLLLASTAVAAPPPAPHRWVTDEAGFLSLAARQRLDARLEAYERMTGHQLVVWIGRSLEGASLDEVAVRWFEAWKVGRKGHDDGLVLFVFAEDRKIAIEVGYGLEDRVTDARAARVIREVMAPRLRAGDSDGAIAAAVDQLITHIEGRPASELGLPEGPAQRPPPHPQQPDAPQITLRDLIVYGIVGLILLVLFIRNPGLFLLFFSGGGGGGGFGGGRGGGWGGGGGFGGGGGRSGGGGARGGW